MTLDCTLYQRTLKNADSFMLNLKEPIDQATRICSITGCPIACVYLYMLTFHYPGDIKLRQGYDRVIEFYGYDEVIPFEKISS